MSTPDNTTPFDPLDPRHLQERARSVFARAARMQDLHGQALGLAQAQRPAEPVRAVHPGAGAGPFNPEALLAHGAGVAMVHTVNTLGAAAAKAALMAQADPVMARLNAVINGTPLAAAPLAEVVDITAIEVPDDTAPTAGA